MTAILDRLSELESLGVVVIADGDHRITAVSERCEAMLGARAGELVGMTLEAALGAAADRALRDIVADGLERAGGWWPATLLGGDAIKLRAFDPGTGLIGLDVLPLSDTFAADPGSIERVAGWNDWLLACTSSAELLRAVVTVTRERLGFGGAWVHRIEADGRSVVVAAEAPGLPDVTGQSVLPSDVPPSQPTWRGRSVPFFVADLGEAGTRLLPQTPELDLEGSALLRPYPEFLARLASLGIRATASLPIVVDGRLWGRVIAHHPAAVRVPAATQSELRLLGAAASARLAELIEQEDAREQMELGRFSLRLMGSVAASPDLLDGLVRSPVDLPGVCAADGAIVAIGGRVACAGVAATGPEIDELLAIARAALGAAPASPLAASTTLEGVSVIAPGTAAGYVAVRLGREPDDLVMWLRRESTRAVTWIEHEVTGDAAADELLAHVTERREMANGACAPWTTAQLAQADELREAIGQVLIARYGQVQALNVELKRSNEAYDTFAQAAAHDLKAPLRTIRQFVDFHLEDMEGRLTAHEEDQLRTVMRMARRMNDLLDDLMGYAQAGKAVWEPRPIDVPGAVADVVELLGVSGAECSVATAPGTFFTDPAALRHILLNLIGNAVKYSPGPATIAIGTTTLGSSALEVPLPASLAGVPAETEVLTVSDRGIGIDPSHHERVFGLFRQLDPAADGTGTGLALCRLICRRHAGDIWLASTPGEGTTFYVATGR